MNPNYATDKLAEFFANTEQLLEDVGRAVQDAVRTHKLLGHPIVIWRDGKVVVVLPEEIDVDGGTNGAAK